VLDSTTSYLPAYTCASLHCTLIAADLHVLQVSRDDTAFSAILPPFSMTAGAFNFLTIYSLDEFKLKRTSGGDLFYVMPSGTSGSFLAEFFDGDPSWSLSSSNQFEMHHSIDFESKPGDFSYSAIRWTGYLRPNVNAIYTLHVYAIGGVRIWLDHKLVLNHIDIPISNGSTILVNLSANLAHHLMVEYMRMRLEASAIINLKWSSSAEPLIIIPAKNFHHGTHLAGSPFSVSAVAGPVSNISDLHKLVTLVTAGNICMFLMLHILLI
jgi:hypothetical protein